MKQPTIVNNQKTKLIIPLFVFTILFVFVIINAASSQTISSVYFGLINNDKKAAVDFLIKIAPVSEFGIQLTKYVKLYGADIESAVFKDQREKKQTINKLEQLLAINPKSRDILYGLYLYYDRLGEKNKAQEFLRRAKDIDPLIDGKN